MIGLSSKIFAWVAGLALIGLAVQTVRIEGFWFIKGYKGQVVNLKNDLAAMIMAGQKATEQQAALNYNVVQTETKNAEIDDVKYDAAKTVAGVAAVRYIDRWRVRKDQLCSSSTDSSAQSSLPGVSEAMPTGTVMVSEGDVQACTGATAYAIEAHNSAVRDVESKTAVFADNPSKENE